MSKKITLIAGDGIGSEVMPAAVKVLEKTGLPLEFTEAEAGWAVFERTGKSVPDETLQAVRDSDATLAGAFTSPNKRVPGHQGAIRPTHPELTLLVTTRPARSRPMKGGVACVGTLRRRGHT